MVVVWGIISSLTYTPSTPSLVLATVSGRDRTIPTADCIPCPFFVFSNLPVQKTKLTDHGNVYLSSAPSDPWHGLGLRPPRTYRDRGRPIPPSSSPSPPHTYYPKSTVYSRFFQVCTYPYTDATGSQTDFLSVGSRVWGPWAARFELSYNQYPPDRLKPSLHRRENQNFDSIIHALCLPCVVIQTKRTSHAPHHYITPQHARITPYRTAVSSLFGI